MHHRSKHAFTLTEMLVVIGIILLLAGALFPVIVKAQKYSKTAQCAARLRSMGQAFHLYMTQNDQTLPPGVNGNSRDSSISAVGIRSWNIIPMPLNQGLTPPYASYVPMFNGAQGFMYPAPPVAYLLGKACPATEGNWNCPTLRTGPAGAFRSYKFVAVDNPNNPQADPNLGMFASQTPGGYEFSPGYMYMAGVENWLVINLAKGGNDQARKISAQYHYPELASRSVAGLKLSEIKSKTGNDPATIVTALDYNLFTHGKASEDLWQNPNDDNVDTTKDDAGRSILDRTPNGQGNAYAANMLFLDGHVEKREFGTVAGFFKQLHGPIPNRGNAGRPDG